MSNNTPHEALAKEIERLTEAHPHVAPLLQAFGPLLTAKERWLQEMQPATAVPMDEDRYRDGQALLRQGPLFVEDDPWQSAGLAVALAIRQGFPLFAEDMAKWAEEIKAGADCYALLDGPTAPEAEDRPSRRLFLEFLARFMLTRMARAMAPKLAPLTWNRGYCPVCAGLPHLAVLRNKGQRFLQCSHCSHEWPFARLTCPACGHEDPENSQILLIEGHKEDSVFICGKCGKYLLTGDRSGSIGVVNADLIALTLVHLDFIAQEKGFRPIAECPWNTLPSSEENLTQGK